MSEPEDREAMAVLRGIWTANQTSRDELEAALGESKSCKTTRPLGFDGFIQRPGDPHNDEVDGDLRAAWRAMLDREGKRVEGADAFHAARR